MDPYKARQNMTEKMLLEKLESKSHNSDICDSETDRSDMSENEYVQNENSDQEECDHVYVHYRSFGHYLCCFVCREKGSEKLYVHYRSSWSL
jgi:hypothetical protein